MNQPKWVLDGVSDCGENSQGYGSTCELEVVKRVKELPDMPQKPFDKTDQTISG